MTLNIQEAKLQRLRGLLAATAMAFLYAAHAKAADTDSCCADLEARIEELDAVTKNVRPTTVTISGHVHRALLQWSDSTERDTYGTDPTNWGTFFEFAGETKISGKWEAGFLIQIDLPIDESSSLNQDVDGLQAAPLVGAVNLFITHEDWGTLTIGKQTEAHDHVTESDLSGTDLFVGPAVTDWNGSFSLRGPAMLALGIRDFDWSESGADQIGDGEEASVLRFDTAEIQGFQASVSYGDGEVSAAALRYETENKLFSFQSGIGVAHYGEPDRSPCIGTLAAGGCTTLGGSFAVLHKPSRISLALAAATILKDPSDAQLANAGPDRWGYAKLAQEWKLTELGATTFYAEYFRGLRHGRIPDDDDTGAGIADFSANTETVGIGIMQSFDAAELQTYIALRHYSINGHIWTAPAERQPLALDDFQAVMAGARISF